MLLEVAAAAAAEEAFLDLDFEGLFGAEWYWRDSSLIFFFVFKRKP